MKNTYPLNYLFQKKRRSDRHQRGYTNVKGAIQPEDKRTPYSGGKVEKRKISQVKKKKKRLFRTPKDCGSFGKEFSCNVGDLGSIPGFRRSSGDGKSYPLSILAWRIAWTV